MALHVIHGKSQASYDLLSHTEAASLIPQAAFCPCHGSSSTPAAGRTRP